jgi:hypothetical protein
LYLTVKEERRQKVGTNKSLDIICGSKEDGIPNDGEKIKKSFIILILQAAYFSETMALT